MKTQHTPGPWSVNGNYIEDDYGTIAKVMRPEANGTLIAAAPELLEALEAMLATFEPSNDLPVMTQARTAIAKARGEL